MDNPRKLIVGFDLCDDYSQISCFSYKTYEPISISPSDDEEDTLIPTALAVRYDTGIWLFGKEAVRCAKEGSAVLVDKLITKLKNKEAVEIDGQSYGPVTLLEKYFRKTLTLIKNYFPTETITRLVVTIDEMDTDLFEGIYEALYMLGIDKDRATVISHGSSFMYYALSQEKELWLNDVGLFDFNENGLYYYQISINRRLNPMIAGMEKRDFSDTLNYKMLKNKKVDLKYAFETIAHTAMYKQIISTLYITGRGFEGGWADDVIKSLCAGRRVFMGQSLYTKGACYAAKELSGDEKLGDIILLNNDMIVSSIWIKVYVDGHIKEVMLSDAAVPWYEVNSEIEVIPDEEADIEIIFRNILTKEIIRERIPLYNLPERPNRMTRLKISISCLDKSKVKIVITDLGFGDIYPALGVAAEYVLDI
ncbi:hypothetical protein DFR55_11618 [Herbinix hemicellulosilytica]|uniref:DUF5716 domain-containing protein n=1 Tax=Herbinix hemicellulosilytica TaxID=1564487 RepID=A0A0H5SEI5_HERHM|nr:DUF5716 family protein [Herbinix hemicellulosilytica]RBP57984.1 hypothetical protein DFR55_11618 [Herbinix hemicellulosilytica]CRZ33465.1 hypothetical protein HHT355_0253 [Herbinix hemicellulosilytica]